MSVTATSVNLAVQLVTPFRYGLPAGSSADWNRLLGALAAARPEHAFWTCAAAAAARLFLPDYERAFRGDPRVRAVIEFTEGSAPSAGDTAQRLLGQIDAIRCGGGPAGAAAAGARWALRTALATYTAPRGPSNPNSNLLWSPGTSPDETDWTHCGCMALTLAADAMSEVIRRERKGWPPKWTVAHDEGKQRIQVLLRDIVGNPLRSVSFSPDWRTDTVRALARQMYELREFSAMPILADALQDAGCDSDDILDHCRDPNQPHVRGCWVVGLVLG